MYKQEEGLEIPPKATQGLLMRMLRYSMETTGESEVTFGQYKTYLYKEVPKDYLEWAITEWSTAKSRVWAAPRAMGPSLRRIQS